MAAQDGPTRSLAEAAASVDTLGGLAQLLRQLRRAHARRTDGRELTYREIAARTGWSAAIVGGYLTGTSLPPTDRFDALILLLGAGPNEQGALATARDRVAEGRHRGHAPPPSTSVEVSVPRDLPAPVAGFTGRVEPLATLDRVLAERIRSGTVVISVLVGTAGVGKTALAVHWAHRVADRFPDGQLYVNLRGFDPSGSPMSPAEAVRGFLDAFGVPPERVPASVTAQLSLYRSLMAGRRVLVILDNARDADQVRPLLPGGSGCAVVVTSRDHLTGLVAAEGAHPVILAVLSADEARDLLVERLGAGRVGAEPTAAAEIAARCANLPLALALVAARAAAHPGFPLAALAAELRSGGGGLDAFDVADPTVDVRAVFSWSYRELTADAARLFRMLGLHPGPDIAIPAAASLAGVSGYAAGRWLSELARAHLLTEHAPRRFAGHDLLRAYATELARTVDTESDRRAAQVRILDHYLHTAHAGSVLLSPHRDPITMAAARTDVTPEDLSDQERALAWFTAERATLLAAVELGAAMGLEPHPWQLAWCLTDYLQRRGHWDDQIATQTTALRSAVRGDDRVGQAHAHRYLGRAQAWLGHHDEATTELEAALELFGQLGDDTGQAHTHLDLGMTYERRADHLRALDHSERSLQLFRAAEHLAGQADALNAVGWVHAQLGDHEQAIRRCEDALALHQKIGDRHAEAGTLDSLGYAHGQLGHHERAVECYHQALELYQETGDRYYQAEILSHLGDAHDSAGDRDSARDAWAQALAIMEELGRRDTERIRAKLS